MLSIVSYHASQHTPGGTAYWKERKGTWERMREGIGGKLFRGQTPITDGRLGVMAKVSHS